MLTLSLGVLLAVAPGAAPAGQDQAPVEPQVTYAVLPLRNLSADRAASADVAERLRAHLGARGATFVPEEGLDEFLHARRIRYTDSLSAADAAAVRASLGARFVLAGAVLEFRREDDPHLAVALRVLDTQTGARILSSVISARGSDSKGLLDLGAIEDFDELAEKVVGELLAPFDAQGVPRARPPVPEAGEPSAARPGPPPGSRIAVLPFGNRSIDPEAGARFTELLAAAWFETAGVEIVEPSELRAALVREKVRYLQEVDARTLALIGKATGVRYFVIGSVERAGEEVLVADERFPEFEASARVVDVETGNIVIAGNVRRRGDDRIVLLGLAAVRDPVALARTSAADLVHELGGG